MAHLDHLRTFLMYEPRGPALLIHLATLQAEAGEELAALDHATTPAGLTARFTAWARPR
ncbi:hypothetical protein ACLQ22_11385 [Micromonospora sp. DT178]|uniref:hypothetical protein n=1 Tax=Micromonospora sp. DT178 TaxID=3393436 RepID=UPI003CF877A1